MGRTRNITTIAISTATAMTREGQGDRKRERGAGDGGRVRTRMRRYRSISPRRLIGVDWGGRGRLEVEGGIRGCWPFGLEYRAIKMGRIP